MKKFIRQNEKPLIVLNTRRPEPATVDPVQAHSEHQPSPIAPVLFRRGPSPLRWVLGSVVPQ